MINVREIPWGIRLFQNIGNRFPSLFTKRESLYRFSVVLLTYTSYTCFHLSRKPLSVVKTVLHRNCSGLTPPPSVLSDNTTWCDWAPFNGTNTDASQRLGEVDSAFLFSYAVAMFASGFIAERSNLRYFLSIGMIMSGIFSYLFGIGKTFNIHNLSYYIVIQIFAGIFQTTGWPGVVTVMSNWFGKKKRGLIFGLWNSHTSLGNILGTVIAAKYVETDWSLSFIMPGLIIGIAGFFVFLFLVVDPRDVGCPVAVTNEEITANKRHYKRLENKIANTSSGQSSDEVDDTEILIGEQAMFSNIHYLTRNELEVQRRLTERTSLLPNETTEDNEKAIGLAGALRIPKVIEFSLSLFFSKLVSYTFLYWLPSYVKDANTFGAKFSSDLSILFDVGGVLGAIAAGVISDQTGMSATTCAGMLLLAAPTMFIYQRFGTANIASNVIILLIVGLFVNGPYALITTSVSADLGTHPSLKGNSKALSTVTAIIDGTGSIGAALGPLLAGFVSSYGWNNVFIVLMTSDVIALILLLRLVRQEIRTYVSSRNRRTLRIE